MGEKGKETQYEIRLFQLLDQAAAWPAGERRERAEAACRTGPISAEALLEALERQEELGDFLEDPAWQNLTGVIAGGTGGGGVNSSIGAKSRPGQTVGRFRLIEPIGRGGMGQVFLAEQDAPYRKVALKLIRSDGLSTATLRRFSVEQQTLARLSHAHIAQLYEADLTDDGEPYFAMEWIDGEPIDLFLKSRPLGLTPRLRLFLDACSAVRHAHQKQIVHRDLKPSNILVHEVDGEPVVKVIDFGIAEALDVSEAKRRKEGVYGTPEYLSPESFDGDVDTRSDVYALGVLLYELLSGTHPFRHGGDDSGSLVERIKKGDALPLSQTVDPNHLGLADEEGIRWASRLRGDLDAIVAKAMRVERDHRYDSVADLAQDVERFLASAPVRARKAGTWHLIRLFSRRRRAAMTAAVVALISVFVGSFGLGFGLLQAQREAEETRLALREAEELSDFLIELFRESDPNRTQGREPTARDLLAKGRERLESEALVDQPLTRARLSRTIGDVYADLGDFKEAEPLLLSALRIFEQETGERSSEVAETLSHLGMMKTKSGASSEAQTYYERSLSIQESSPATEPLTLALTVYHLGVVAFRTYEYDTAQDHFDRACPLMMESGTEEQQARCLEALGRLHLNQKSFDEARSFLEQALQIRESALGPNHPHVATSLASLCALEQRGNRLTAAAEHCVRALEIRQRNFDPGFHLTVSSLDQLGAIRYEQGRFAEAEELYQQAVEEIQRLPKEERRWEMNRLTRLGWLDWLQEQYAEAEQRYSEVLALFENPESSQSSSPGTAMLGLGLTSWKLGRFDEAEQHLMRAQAFYLKRFATDGTRAAWTYWGLAGVYRDRGDASRGDLERAGELYRQALEIRRRHYPQGNRHLKLTEDDYALYLSKTSRQSPDES